MNTAEALSLAARIAPQVREREPVSPQQVKEHCERMGIRLTERAVYTLTRFIEERFV